MNDLEHQVAMASSNLNWAVSIVADMLLNERTRRLMEREFPDLLMARDDLNAIILNLELTKAGASNAYR